MTKSSKFSQNVFINCPFDNAYDPLFLAIIFTIHRFDLRPRSSLEVVDTGLSRLEKIMDIMADSKYGIHDISRVQLTRKLPRFNMPFELGIDFGLRRAGGSTYRSKCHLIMDSKKYQYMKTTSDLNGRDPAAHYDKERNVVCIVRDWLANVTSIKRKPSGLYMIKEFRLFKRQIPRLCDELELHPGSLTFLEYSDIAATFLKTWKLTHHRKS
jgi:hypothetical protein